MKLVFLFALWLPVSSLLLFFALVNLLPGQNRQMKLAVQKEAQAQDFSQDFFSLTPSSMPSDLDIHPSQDIRVLVLKKFLKDYRSPLVDLAEDLVRIADLWGLDYTLLPAIAMQESGGCKKIPVDSYNCWGFGIYGDKVTRFSSYQEGAHQVAKTIKETYIKNGLTNPTLLEDLWAPPSKGLWSYAVNYFIGKIKEYEKNTPAA